MCSHDYSACKAPEMIKGNDRLMILNGFLTAFSTKVNLYVCLPLSLQCLEKVCLRLPTMTLAS